MNIKEQKKCHKEKRKQLKFKKKRKEK